MHNERLCPPVAICAAHKELQDSYQRISTHSGLCCNRFNLWLSHWVFKHLNSTVEEFRVIKQLGKGWILHNLLHLVRVNGCAWFSTTHSHHHFLSHLHHLGVVHHLFHHRIVHHLRHVAHSWHPHSRHHSRHHSRNVHILSLFSLSIPLNLT